MDNTRLRYRIHYLEAGMKQVRDSLPQTLNTVIIETIQSKDLREESRYKISEQEGFRLSLYFKSQSILYFKR